MNYHKTVMLDETLNLLNIKSGGTYIDATLGGGGLSGEILKKLDNNGRLIAIDIDKDAIDYCKEKFKNEKKILIFNCNFTEISEVLKELKINKVDGICVDLGVSSHQIDCAERGFSYIHDAPLDMRMGQSGASAYDIVNFTEESKLSNIIHEFGEEKFAKLIAKSVCRRRKIKKIETTRELVEIIQSVVPKRFSGHPAKKTFQAIRISVNNELENLDILLDNCVKLLSSGGRLAVLSFHSLEDRIVKQKMKFWEKTCICPPNAPICTCSKKKEAFVINKKAITSSSSEIKNNPRSKSAKLRVCEKI
ncbi:MAG: 16S rRNA (cytosine(1402)-N(4))-methyltransferase RsmH [Clostridia bacterium]|nr:16S rRNA (cytosine(1402)-N(4))-methyltransferase RsmH [Clostridia bacterium]